MSHQKKLEVSKITTENQWHNGNQALSKIKPTAVSAESKSLIDTGK